MCEVFLFKNVMKNEDVYKIITMCPAMCDMKLSNVIVDDPCGITLLRARASAKKSNVITYKPHMFEAH